MTTMCRFEEVKRTIAKSMSLIEVTDEFFEQTIKILEENRERQKMIFNKLVELYRENIGMDPDQERSNDMVIDAFTDILLQETDNKIFSEIIEEYFENKKFIFEKIKERRKTEHFFKQPTVLLAYYLTDKIPSQTRKNWPLLPNNLEIIFSDLGKRY